MLVLNTAVGSTTVTLSVANDVPGKPQGPTMRDVWNHKDVPLGNAGEITLTLNTHDSILAVLSNVSDQRWWVP